MAQKFAKSIATLNNGSAATFRQNINNNFSAIGSAFDVTGVVGCITASSTQTDAEAIAAFYGTTYPSKGDVIQVTSNANVTTIYLCTTGGSESVTAVWGALNNGTGSATSIAGRTGEYSDLLNTPTIPDPSDSVPVADDETGSIGTTGSNKYALADHRHPDHFAATDTTPKDLGTASLGSETTTFARGDHVHQMPSVATTGSNGLMGSGDKLKLDTLNAKIILKQNVLVQSSGWIDQTDFGTSYTGKFEKQNTISVEGMTANHFPEVVLNIEQAESGYFAPIVNSGAGTITIYAMDKSEATGSNFYIATVKGTATV